MVTSKQFPYYTTCSQHAHNPPFFNRRGLIASTLPQARAYWLCYFAYLGDISDHMHAHQVQLCGLCWMEEIRQETIDRYVSVQ